MRRQKIRTHWGLDTGFDITPGPARAPGQWVGEAEHQARYMRRHSRGAPPQAWEYPMDRYVMCQNASGTASVIWNTRSCQLALSRG